ISNHHHHHHMDDMTDDENNSTASSTAVESKGPTSFVYTDLIFHVQTIQHHMFEIVKFLDNQCKIQKNIQKQLKSRSITFIDPYGNSITDEYMDHELISTIFKNYKKNYVPKYLHQSIKIGTMNQDVISSLDEYYLNLSVSEYPDAPQPCVLHVLVTDTMEKVKMRIQKLRKLPNIEFAF
ncbi:unnamed protein product, partial [Rotaria sp. Silwood1]